MRRIIIIFLVFLAIVVLILGGSLWWKKTVRKISGPRINIVSVLQPVLGTMIENELLARPFQTGLSQADIVYEAPTEGGITRFLAIFENEKYLGKMGPIRSARTYFLDWIHEYKGVFAHVGGNPDVLARLQKEKIYNADQFFYEKDTYFWRENVGKTVLEHTMFTSGRQLKKLIQEKNWVRQTPEDSMLTKKRGAKEKSLEKYPQAYKISIDFGYPTYQVDYSYDEVTQRYLRFQAKKPHIDQGNKIQISASVIVIQRVKAWPNNDTEGSISIKTIGEGDATIFQFGRAIKGLWKKEKLEGPTKFFNETGEEISFGSGPIWIEVLPFQNFFTFQGTPPLEIPILMYHYIGSIPLDQKNNAFRKDLTVSKDSFEAQLKWLKEKGFTAIYFTNLLRFLNAEKEISLPKKPVVLSFDDGYEDAYTEAFPVLKKYGFRGAFAIITGKIGQEGYLTWEQILEMKKAGMEFLSHSVSHMDLRTLSNKTLGEELTQSKKILEEKLSAPIIGFVYPAGKYNQRIIEAVKKAGYKAARTTKNGKVTRDSKIFELPTVRVKEKTFISP